MKAAEYIPLVMEPESRFYVDTVVVLDFQSLYPSIIMAYNYCYTTCLGRVQDMCKADGARPYEFGCAQLKVRGKNGLVLFAHLTPISCAGVSCTPLQACGPPQFFSWRNRLPEAQR